MPSLHPSCSFGTKALLLLSLALPNLQADLPTPTTTFMAEPGLQLGFEANWSNGLPSSTNPGLIDRNGVFNEGPGAGWIVIHSAGLLTSGFNRVFGGGVVWYMTGGEVLFYNAGAEAWRNWNGGVGGFTLNMSGGTFEVAVIQVTNNSVLNMSGGVMTLQNNLNANTGTINLLAGDGIITTPNMANTDGTVNAFSGWTGSLTVSGWTAGNFEGRWIEGILTFEGSNAGNFNDIFEVDGSTLTLRTGAPPPTGFAAWIDGFGITGADALPGADPRNDGLSNLYIYAQGGIPTTPNSVARPAIEHVGNELRLSFSRIADPDLIYTVYVGSDLNRSAASAVWTSSSADNVTGPVTVVIDVPDTKSFAWLSVDQ